MSNLVTPMLTSVENSQTVDFYPASIRFTNSPCAIINNVSDQICISENSDWGDLSQLMERSNLFKTSTPNKAHSIAFNKRNFGNSYNVSNENSRIQDAKQQTNDYAQDQEHSIVFHNVVERSKVINNTWKVTGSENNSCSKECNNVNMGYNEGSSLESMVSNKKNKSKQDFTISKNAVEMCNKPTENTTTKIIDSNTNKSFAIPLPPSIYNNYQPKSFKNGSKTGHSRQWGSCGSTTIFHLSIDEANIKTKLSTELKQMNTLHISQNPVVLPMVPTTSTTEMRNKSFSQSNRLKRISQLSFEAEFDSDGRTHEQITIDFTKFDPYTIAGQITQMELTYFKAIKSEEFLSFKWTALSKHTHAPGIVASTRWFNQLNFWAQRIILECTELNRRSEMLIYLIRIIKKLVDSYNNLSSAMALMSALEVECIHRLKQTWNTLPNRDRATYRRMEELFSSTNNFEKLREHINSLKLPCIPYLGLYLTDLTYINIAHSKLSEFESQTKTDQINNILRTVSEFQQSEYDINEISALYRYLESQRYIEELQKIIEENNYRTSISLEPNMDPSGQNTRQQQQQQQQDFNTYGSTSPQKTPPSYACQHVTSLANLQSPISPKPMPSKPHNESINEVPEQQQQQEQKQVILSSVEEQNMDYSADNDVNKVQSTINGDSVAGIVHQDTKDVLSYEESLMMSSRHSADDDNDEDDDEKVRVTLLCGTSKKSQFKKRNSMSTSHRFQRHSQSSSRRRGSSKTTTLSSNSQSGVSDSQPSKSLLDDSYLDATATETCSGPLEVAGIAHGTGMSELSTSVSKYSEQMCAPPICKCIFKGDVIDLKPKATSKGKTKYSNLVNIAHAAEVAAQYSEKVNFYYPTSDNSDHEDEEMINVELPTIDDKESLRLVCQGVLSRMVCLKNSKKSRFSMWNRQWIVLLMSKNNAFLVFFENSQFRALDRKDFKSKKCHVQDMKRVVVSRHRPSLNKCISEQSVEVCPDTSVVDGGGSDGGGGGSDGDHGGLVALGHGGGDLKKFFLTDQEYGTVYKFRDPSGKGAKVVGSSAIGGASGGSKRRSGGGGDHNVGKEQQNDSPSCLHTEYTTGQSMPSLAVWYHSIKRCLRVLASPADDHKDLIVLGDT